MSKLKNMRGIEIKRFRAVSSGLMTLNDIFGENGFDSWINQRRHLLTGHMYEPTNFLWHEDDNITWNSGRSTFILAIRDDVTEVDVAPYEIIEFPGGTFLVATGDENDNNDLEETIGCMMAWIENNDVFEYGEFPKSGMCNMPNADGAFDKALNIAQQQIYLPLKLRAK
jgi:hypothetical protein